MAFTVRHGGQIRYSAVVSSGESTYWTKGRLLTLNTSAQWIVHTAARTTYPMVGVAMEDRVSATSTGPTTTLNKIGAPTGDRYSAILDPAVIEMEQNLESGVEFSPGAVLFCSTNGKVTCSGATLAANIANALGSNSNMVGFALTNAHSADPNRKLTWLFSPNKLTY